MTAQDLERLHRAKGTGPLVAVPAIGLEVRICLDPAATGGSCSAMESTHAPGCGPPLHRHREAEFFRVLEGRYRYRVGDREFTAEAGDTTFVPGGVTHAFVNIGDRPARQFVMVLPGLDLERFFTEFAAVMRVSPPVPEALARLAEAWGMEFLGPPLAV